MQNQGNTDIIMAVGSYGAEWIGMNHKRTCKIQSTVDQAMRIAYVGKAKSQNLKSLLLCTEMGITPVSVHCTLQRICIWQKQPHPKKILGNLITSPDCCSWDKSWVLNTQTNIEKLKRGAEVLEDHDDVNKFIQHRVAWININRDLKNVLKPEAGLEKVTQQQQDDLHLRDKIYQYLLHKEFNRESNQNEQVQKYDKYSFGRITNFISTSINVPGIK